ncbi:S49 family peptidase [Notoacmeibacter sp. MSK16QG-6]|uniref:S49 family peptidase n=1 Tax=Notoacmeibacter sp. MSK16QG-6 TaxID=2957982 RepID=UPI0020A07DA3|nr:S49 family peptidase [Notoacmeibacter sp. MSK16QG-6]MCP1198258.1 S49 family peptidase [Notoacmeibacter sp. MSK16QG-6]
MANFLKSLVPARFRSEKTVIPVVRLQGAISAAAGSPLRQGLSFATAAPLLHRAFSIKSAPAVAIAINSPGGSPVQSRQIFQRIRALAEEKEKAVFVFCEDVAASGGYMIAIAGDEIYADPSSIVGSIGVLYAGFGFTEAIEKLGIERRVYTAGENKATLDPFQPIKEDDVERLKSLQLEIHDVFKDMVRERRAGKLSDDPELFTGAFWTGQGALSRGLIDGLGDVRSVLREKYGDKVRLKPIAPSGGLLGRRISPFRNDLAEAGAGVAGGLVQTIEERLIWQRFGL